MVCRQQVDQAEVREAAVRIERLALRDECAPRDGRATCLPARARDKRSRDMNDVMAALR
jgi:hypothetical protein